MSYQKNKTCFKESGGAKAMNFVNSHPKTSSNTFHISDSALKRILNSERKPENRTKRKKQSHLTEKVSPSIALPAGLGKIGFL